MTESRVATPQLGGQLQDSQHKLLPGGGVVKRHVQEQAGGLPRSPLRPRARAKKLQSQSVHK